MAGHGDEVSAFATPSDWGQLLRRRRRLAGWTQEELAHRAGVSVRAIRDFEAGRVRRPHGQTIRMLTEALDLTDASREELQSIIRAARHANGSLAAVDGPGGPCQLPRDVDDFIGRSETLAKVRDHLASAHTATSVPVCAVAGMAGVGKTTLAVHVAHQLRPWFHDGQYYVDLRGMGAKPLVPDEVLDGFLRSSGLDGAGLPGNVDQRATLWRSYLAGRRVLLVLDNVATEAQIRPMLPGASGCGVLITSRSRLAGLDAARLISLDLLPAGQAMQLLARIAGTERIGSQPDAAEAIVRFCAGLPLAVRLAGARLAARPQWPAQRLVDLLADEHRRLDALAVGDREVRPALRRATARSATGSVAPSGCSACSTPPTSRRRPRRGCSAARSPIPRRRWSGSWMPSCSEPCPTTRTTAGTGSTTWCGSSRVNGSGRRSDPPTNRTAPARRPARHGR